MLSLKEIFLIIFIHWIADFVLQTDKQARGKSKNWIDLLSHTLTYSITWWGLYTCLMAYSKGTLFPAWSGIRFFIITFVCHTITDYFTSRINSYWWKEVERAKAFSPEDNDHGDMSYRLHLKLRKEQEIGKYTHRFFVFVGFDQVLHYIQLFLTYKILVYG